MDRISYDGYYWRTRRVWSRTGSLTAPNPVIHSTQDSNPARKQPLQLCDPWERKSRPSDRLMFFARTPPESNNCPFDPIDTKISGPRSITNTQQSPISLTPIQNLNAELLYPSQTPTEPNFPHSQKCIANKIMPYSYNCRAKY